MQQDHWQPTRLSVAAWSTYDLANTIFALGVGGLYFADWLTENETPDLALALAIDAAMVLVIVLGPWIGARSDHRGRRVPYLAPATLVAVIPTFFLATVGVGPSLVLFAVALVGFNLGSVVYDALLPDVSTPANRGFISGLGVGIGYLGSFVGVGVGIVLLDSQGYSGVFKAIAVLFLLFALPTFLFVRERPRPARAGPPPALLKSLSGLVGAWRRARRYEGVTRFLIGRFLYTDAINTLIGGFLIFFIRNELDFTDDEVQGFLLVSIIGSMAGAFIAGRLVDVLGPHRILMATITTWIGSIVIGIIAVEADVRPVIWVLAVTGGLALGSTWAADRTLMSRISPPSQLGEFYGLYATVGRFATILGPLSWGLVVTVLGLPRTVAMGVLVMFLIASRIVLAPISDRRRSFAE